METKNVNVLAKINNVEIQVVNEKENVFVPIRSICDALGVDFSSQKQRIERDEILSSTVVMTTIVAADGKDREMLCLPFKFTLGWLFSIDLSRVNEAAKPLILNYKLECYEALYNYFTEPTSFLQEKQKLIDKYLDEYDTAKRGFKNAKTIMEEKKKAFDQVRHFSIDEWRSNGRQYVIPFSEDNNE